MLFPHKGSYFATSSLGVVSTTFNIDLVTGGGEGGVVQDCNKRTPHQGGKGNAQIAFCDKSRIKMLIPISHLAC